MKKRTLFFIICTFAIMLLQTAVFADMGAPMVEPYKASIANVNGAKYYDFEGNVVGELNYGDVIVVSYEIQDWKTKEIDVNFSFSKDDIYESYYMNITDIMPIENENLKEKYLKEEKREIIILKEDGLEISEGPAYAYNETGVIIPKGEKIYGHSSMNGEEPWIYVSYKGTSGWICELDGTIGSEKEYEDSELLTLRKTKIYSDSNYTKPIAEIPANTFITEFLEIDPWSQGKYVTYNGISGYISMADYAVNFSWMEEERKAYDYLVNYPEVKLYKEASVDSEVLIENIPEGTNLEYYYSDDIRAVGWIYTSYQNVDGWVFYVEEGEDYKEYLENEKQYSNQVTEEDVNIEEPIENIVNDKKQENVVLNENAEEVSKQPGSTITSATQIVILCAMFGVTIAVTSIVTIALVNRKKNN